MSSSLPLVYVIVLNWNGWRDTIECLESVLRSDYPALRVIVCDNGSNDDSVSRILDWAAGRQAVVNDGADGRIRALTDPPLPKPIGVSVLDADASAAAARFSGSPVESLIVIRAGRNLGFAAGVNVGLRFALSQPEMKYAWVLNNDTVVHGNAIQALVAKMESDPGYGLCGSLLIDYAHPERVQARGGFFYNRWTAQSRAIEPARFPDLQSPRDIERRMFGIQGAAVFASRNFLEKVGLLSEDYFLYFEEQDWALRARGRFRLGYAEDSIVFHKIGASSLADSGLSVYRYALRSRIVFTRKFFWYALPSVYLMIMAFTLKRLFRGDWRRVRIALSVLGLQ